MYRQTCFVLMLFVAFSLAEPTSAQSSVLTYPDSIVLKSETEGESVSQEFTVSTGSSAVTNLQFIPSSLTDKDGRQFIAPENITISPLSIDRLEPNASLTVAVSINDVPASGNYVGDITIAYDQQPDGTGDTIDISLTVGNTSEESGTASPEDSTQTRPTLRIEAVGGEPLALTLAEDGTEYIGSIVITALGKDVEISELRLINFSNLTASESVKPVVLAAQATSSPSEPQTLKSGETKHFTITYPKPVQPGNYKGTLEIAFDDQPTDEKYIVRIVLNAVLPSVTVEPEDGVLSLALEEATGNYKGTFILAVNGGTIDTIAFNATNLKAVNEQAESIYADKVTVIGELTEIRAGGSRIFTVSVLPPKDGASYKKGTYKGSLILSYASPIAVNAQRSKNLDVEVITSPEAGLKWAAPPDDNKIAFSAIIEKKSEPQQYTVLLEETGDANDVSDLTVITLPFLATTPNDTIITLPANKIIGFAANNPTTIQAGQQGKLELTFDFSVEGTQPGLFKGEIQIAGRNTNEELIIPVELTLKKSWWWGPFLMWLVGIGLGLLLTFYQSEFLEKDRRRAAIQRWQERLNKEEAENDPHGSSCYQFYGERMQANLELAELMLNEKWQNNLIHSQELLDEVGTLNKRWHSEKHELWRQYQRIKTILNDLKELPFKEFAYCQILVDEIESIKGQRHTYADAPAMKVAIDDQNKKFDKFLDIHTKGQVLDYKLGKIKEELEEETYNGFSARIRQQSEDLEKADDDASLENIKQSFDEIEKELQQAYTEYPHYLYKKGCYAVAKKCIEDVDQRSKPPPQWDKLKSKFSQALNRAEDYIRNRINFEQASRLAHNTWRAAWFYKEAIIDVRQQLDAHEGPISGDAREALETELRENVIWLLTADYTEYSPSEFEQELFKNRMQRLYATLGNAVGDADLIKSPFPDEQPSKPVRRLEEIKLEQSRESQFVPPWDFREINNLPQDNMVSATRRMIRNLAIRIVRDPHIRISLFTLAIHVVTIIGLYWFGLEFWEQDATFGDSGLDYLQLFLIGFGGNAIKDNLLNIVKTWGVKVPSVA